MTKITMHIEADTAKELHQLVADLANTVLADNLDKLIPYTVVEHAAKVEEPTQKATSKKAKPTPAPEVKPEPQPEPETVQEPAPEPAPEPEQVQEEVAAPEPEPTPEPEQPAVKVEQVREKLKQISKAGKQPQVKALIEAFGASALSEVPAGKLAELLVKAEAL